MLETAIYFVVHSNYESQKEQILTSSSEIVKTNFDNIYNSFETLANTVYKGYINKKSVIEAFASRNREKLYAVLEKDYLYLASIDFKQLHFHLPNNDSFLRMHQPKRFGDNLTDIRFSVANTNQTHQITTGLEMGRVVPGFRYVYPMFDDEKHIGSVETSFSVNAFIHKLERVYDVHTHFLLTKEMFNQKIFDSYRKYYEPSIESSKYITLIRTVGRGPRNKELHLRKLFETKLYDEVNYGLQTQKTFSFAIKVDLPFEQKLHKTVTFLALKNIQKQHIGYFVIYQDSKLLADLDKQSFRRFLVFSFINMLAMAFLYRELSTKAILSRKIKEKTQALTVKTKELKELNHSLEDIIRREVDKSRQQEQQLFEVEKMAQMGEMIGNIAHQWRQPLSIISTSASGVKLKSKLKLLDEKELDSFMEIILKNSQFLSETIDTFRDFIKEKKELKEVVLQDELEQVLFVVSASLRNNFIQLVSELEEEPCRLKTIPKELSQVVINIINNAKDAIKSKGIEDAWIKIKLTKDNTHAIITIEDNAGGIPIEVLPKIFDPYFTTKHQSQGTGLGLHMSRKIIHESLNGMLFAQNSELGAKFFIRLPLT